MGALKLAFLIAALVLAAPAAARVDHWSGHVAEASARFGIPSEWIRRVMTAESGGRTMLHGRPIRSSAGAMGLMQLMPGTWREVRRRLGLGSDPHDPRDNVLAGTYYLRQMYDRFGYPGLFGAYNAGPARFAAHLSKGRRLPAETIAYVAKVAGGPAEPVRPPATPRRVVPLFAVVRSAQREADVAAGSAEPAGAGSLFVALGGGASRRGEPVFVSLEERGRPRDATAGEER